MKKKESSDYVTMTEFCIHSLLMKKKICNKHFLKYSVSISGTFPGVLFPTHRMINNEHFYHFNKLIFEIIEEITNKKRICTKQSIIDEVTSEVICYWNSDVFDNMRDVLPIVRPSILNRYIKYLNEHDVVQEYKNYRKFLDNTICMTESEFLYIYNE